MPLDNVVKEKPTARVKIPPLSKQEIAALGTDKPQIIRITKPKLRTTAVSITGITPYVQHKFSEKSRRQMEATQEAGQQAKGKKVRDPKDFNAVYEAAKHYSQDGWIGIPASAFRNAMIDACRLVGFKMTVAKLSIFIEADGLDRDEGTPLVRIIGQPRIHKGFARNATGVADIRWRPMWEQWSANLRLTWDNDQFAATDVVNLLVRAGMQVGIGEGRPGSPNSNGMDWGRFKPEGYDINE